MKIFLDNDGDVGNIGENDAAGNESSDEDMANLVNISIKASMKSELAQFVQQ